MAAFPFRYSVEDLLGLGVNLEPEQEAVVTAPRLKAVALTTLPDPCCCGGCEHTWVDENGKIVLVPIVYDIASPNDPESVWTVEKGKRVQRTQPFAEHLTQALALQGDSMVEEVFDTPKGFGTAMHMDPLIWRSPFHLDEELHARQVWDCFAVTEPEARMWQDVTELALASSGFYELHDWFAQLEYGDEHENPEMQQHLEDTVLDGKGELKDPVEFTPHLVMDRHVQYQWDRLQDLSQRGWEAWAQTESTPAAREAVSRRWDNPWRSF